MGKSQRAPRTNAPPARPAPRPSDNEALLSGTGAGYERRRGSAKLLNAWLAKNKKGLQLVEDWLRMRAEGTCWKSTAWLAEELGRSHGLPRQLATAPALQSWLRANRPEQYEAAR